MNMFKVEGHGCKGDELNQHKPTMNEEGFPALFVTIIYSNLQIYTIYLNHFYSSYCKLQTHAHIRKPVYCKLIV